MTLLIIIAFVITSVILYKNFARPLPLWERAIDGLTIGMLILFLALMHYTGSQL